MKPAAPPRSALFTLWSVGALLLLTAAILMIGFYAPIEAKLGIVQKIFYFHLPSAFMMYAGFGVAFVGSLAFLWTKQQKWDEHAATGAEIGLVFASMVLVSGPLWARKSWGAYWSWSDPQLVAVLMVFLLFLSYTAVRAFAADGERRRTISAVIAVLASTGMPFIHWAVTVTHPKIIRKGGGGLAAPMTYTLLLSVAAFVFLFLALYWMRLRLERDQNKSQELRRRTLNLEDKVANEQAGSFLGAKPQVAFSVALLAPLVSLAQGDGFVTTSAPTQEDVSGMFLLTLAYTAMWLLLMGYVIWVWRRQGGVFQDIKALNEQLKQLEKKSGE